MKQFSVILLLCVVSASVFGAKPDKSASQSSKTEAGRIYDAPDPSAAGGIEGRLSSGKIRHVIAVDHDFKRRYLAEVMGDGQGFRLHGMAIGKYDLVIFTTNDGLYEGLTLGDPADKMEATSKANLQKRIAAADAFFNRSTIHRAGLVDDRLFVLVERIRDRKTLTQAGKVMDSEIRRVEVAQLNQATDDWQLVDSFFLYREPEPGNTHHPFLTHQHLPSLGNLRIVDSIKKLGTIELPK